jgi:cytoplasmic iron level regulating protein YaaA (DUF328/UPF0246 family)
MLIIVPSSESKRPPAASGRPVILEELSFPSLLPARRRIAEALIETSADLDAFERLHVRPTMARQVAQNTQLFELPAIPVLDVYTGPVHDGLDAARLSRGGAARAERSLVVVSALWGALRPADRIPPYRLLIWSRLVGLDRLEPIWRGLLPAVLAAAASNHGVVVDIRSPAYQAVGMPAGLGDRTVTLKVAQSAHGHRIGEVITKRLRGEAAHHLLESGADPASPDDVADVLAGRWPVHLRPPDRHGRPWTMTLSLD